jgi:hypothetical protein
MIPVPSEERTFYPKRFRGAPRYVNTEPAVAYLHNDAMRRSKEIATFANNPVNVIVRGLSQRPPSGSEHRQSLRHVDAPCPKEHPVGRRNPHRVAPIDDFHAEQLFPRGGMSVRPIVERAATSMEANNQAHHIFAHVSYEAPAHPGRRVYPKAMERSTRGDLSLMHTGVKRVDIKVTNDDPNAIAGFTRMGQYSEAADRPSGKKLVTAEPYDPVRIFESYGRRHPIVLPVTSNY